MPKDPTLGQRLVETVGQDGDALMRALREECAPPAVLHRPAIQTLRTIWLQQYDGPHASRWRSAEDRPPHAHLRTSPDAVEARFATKRQTSWPGDTVHLTAPGDEEGPQRITTGETTAATTTDGAVTDTIHAQLAARELLPAAHVRDRGSVAADVLVASQQQQVEGIGPVLSDTRWQAQQPDGLDVRGCARNWEARRAICPAGKVRVRWVATHDRPGAGQDSVALPFDANDGQACPLRPRCTQAQREDEICVSAPRSSMRHYRALASGK